MDNPANYNSHAYAVVRNDSQVAIKSITLYHRYSDDEAVSQTWTNVEAGATTSPALEAGFNTGFIRFGGDYWWITITLLDDSVWNTAGSYITYTLHPVNDGKTVTFVISGSVFAAPDGTNMKLLLQEVYRYNSWAAIKISNHFPVDAQVTLNHLYKGGHSTKKTWKISGGFPGSDSDPLIVYFDSGFITGGTDYWNISVILDIQPYDNNPTAAFAEFTNATKDVTCMLRYTDNGKLHTFIINGSQFFMGLQSGACADVWKTWNGYNTLTFIRIKNGFTLPIKSVKLSHQYSSDTVWDQTRAMIPVNRSSDYMVVEYFTGPTHPGFDYWNVYVYLSDGTWYQNYKLNKECYLTVADAQQPLTFTVSADTFSIALPSGSCTDSMVNKGRWDPSFGRDVTQSYNLNAFIGSHNAFANFAEGFWYAQQSSSIYDQMVSGATTLLLDIHYKNNDIYLIHEYSVLQPFAADVKLSKALTDIKNYLSLFPDQPITIVFQDEVKNQAYQYLIKQAFVDSGTWDMVFNADVFKVNARGWPTLQEITTKIKRPIVVFTSNKNSPDFPYQWEYMSENKYGNESLDPKTWLNKRDESEPLNTKKLCALNHFPSWSVEGFKLSTWIDRSDIDNASALVKQFIDACYTKYSRYPNWINADFWEFPQNGIVSAIYYLNKKLRNLPADDVLLVRDNKIITELINYENLIIGDWKSERLWLNEHWDAVFLPLTDSKTNELTIHQLEHVVNLSLVISCLTNKPAIPEVNEWVKTVSGKLIAYLFTIEQELFATISTGNNRNHLPYCIPFLLFENTNNIRFRITGYIKQLAHHYQLQGNDHDSLLLAALAGDINSIAKLRESYQKSIQLFKENTSLTTSQGYDLSHAILYGILAGVEQEFYTGAAGLLEQLLTTHMPANIDLGAELLTCYWLCGGKPNDITRTAVRQLKNFSYNDDCSCAKSGDSNITCCAPKEVLHHKLTMLMGLSSTLIFAGEVLGEGV